MASDSSCDELEVLGTAELIGPLEASHPLPRRCLLRDVWVTSSQRRRGIARLLLAAAEELARAKGEACVSLEVDGDNAAALQLYEQAGYAEASGDSPADALLSPLAPLIRSLPGWARGRIVMMKDVSEPA